MKLELEQSRLQLMREVKLFPGSDGVEDSTHRQTDRQTHTDTQTDTHRQTQKDTDTQTLKIKFPYTSVKILPLLNCKVLHCNEFYPIMFYGCNTL